MQFDLFEDDPALQPLPRVPGPINTPGVTRRGHLREFWSWVGDNRMWRAYTRRQQIVALLDHLSRRPCRCHVAELWRLATRERY